NMSEAVKEAGVESYFMGTFGSLQVDRIIQNKEGELSVSRDLIGTVRNVISSQAAQKNRQKENERKHQIEREKREEAHKNAFDISTREGQAAFEAFHAERARKEDATR